MPFVPILFEPSNVITPVAIPPLRCAVKTPTYVPLEGNSLAKSLNFSVVKEFVTILVTEVPPAGADPLVLFDMFEVAKASDPTILPAGTAIVKFVNPGGAEGFAFIVI